MENAFDGARWKILEKETHGFCWLEFLLLHEHLFDWVGQKGAKKPESVGLSSRMQNDYSLAAKMVSPQTVWKLSF